MNNFYLHKSLIEIRKIWAIIRKDKYDRLAAQLQDALLLGWDSATSQAINDVIRAIQGREKFTTADLDRMIARLRPLLGLKFSQDMAAPLLEIHLGAYGQGIEDIIKITPTFQLIDERALDMLQRHNVYWVRNFYDAQLAEQIRDLGTQIIEQGLTREEAGQLYEENFAGKFQNYSWRYWQGFSNHVVTRSRELGAVEGYVRAGAEYLQVRAVLDGRTTAICREMHGRIIPVSNAVKLRDRLLEADLPDAVKQIAPWLDPDQVRGKKSSRLSSGLALPPYHFNCRTRTVIYRPADDKYQVEELEYGPEVSRKDKKILNGLTPEEYSNWLATIQGRKKLRFDPQELPDAFDRDSGELGVKTTDAYINLANNYVRNAQAVFAQVVNGQKQFVFLGENGYAVVDEDTRLIGARPYSSGAGALGRDKLRLK